MQPTRSFVRRVHLLAAASALLVVVAAHAGTRGPHEPVHALDLGTPGGAIALRAEFTGPGSLGVVTSKVVDGPARGHDADPPLLRLRLLDGNGQVLEEMNSWHPLWSFVWDSDGEHLVERTSGVGRFVVPNLPDLASVEVVDVRLGRSLGFAPVPDLDGDGVRDAADNCTGTANAAQADLDEDSVGDPCDDADAGLDLRRARIRRTTHPGRPNGEIIVTGEIVLAATGDAFDATAGVVVEIRDGLQLHETFAWTGAECRRHASGRLTCRTAAGDFTQIAQPLTAKPGRIRFRLRFTHRALTGGFAPDLAVRLTHTPPVARAGIDRIGTLERCRTRTNGILCTTR